MAFLAAAAPPPDWGVLLVRKGGFAIARPSVPVTADKVGRRHVQGRTKAGGQSQQRFARRRANQARAPHEAAADHAA
ncbi:MAG: Vms1/Ankzf1 family peptidyl-tRNA hydrolase [Nocardioides sp.]